MNEDLTIKDELRNIHGEPFCVLKEKEVRLYGEYRTGLLVLESWDKLEG